MKNDTDFPKNINMHCPEVKIYTSFVFLGFTFKVDFCRQQLTS